VLKRIVASKLKHHWSPKQIAGWLKRTYSQDERKQMSHETIYRSLFIQARGVLKKELQQYLRTQRAIRRGKQHSKKMKGWERSPVWYRSGSVLLRSMTVPFRVTGKAI
jgi:IS30 family transposase